MRRATNVLTERQAEVLDFIISNLSGRGFPPTVAEIATKFKFASPNAAASHLNALRKKGYINVEPRASRGIEVMKNPSGDLAGPGMAPSLPIIGRVAAGSPILAEESVEDRLVLDAEAFRKRPDYLLRVHGDSMVDVGIYEGDLIAVHRTQEVRTGDVIVARINGDVTVKTLRRKGKDIALEPANPKYKPILVNAEKDDFTIEGQCVGVLRAL